MKKQKGLTKNTIPKKYIEAIEKEKRQVKIFSYIVLFVALTFPLSIGYLVYSYPIVEHTLEEKFYHPYFNIQFKSISENFQDESIIKSVSNICQHKPKGYEQLNCVKSIVADFYDFQDRNTLNDVRNPSKVFSNGGLCRDYAIIYDSIYSNLGYETEFVIIPGHIYNKVIYEGVSYEIDGTSIIMEELK